MRKLQSTDIFAFCRIINAVGIKEEIKAIAMKANSLKDINKEEAGFDLLFSLFEKASGEKAEEELFKFFANIFEEDVEIVKKMDPVEFIDKLMEAADIEKWKLFFSRVAALTKRS